MQGPTRVSPHRLTTVPKKRWTIQCTIIRTSKNPIQTSAADRALKGIWMTLSIRNFLGTGHYRAALLAAGLFAGAEGGCYHAPTSAPSAPPPLIVDQAMQERDWSRSAAYYQNGGVKSTSLRTTFATGPHNSRLLSSGLETTAFVGNLAVMPLTLFSTPFNTRVIYHGEQVGPTFNAIPALPPSNYPPTSANGQAASGAPAPAH